MTSFIYTPRGYVNLGRVDVAKHLKSGRHQIVVDDEEIDNNCVNFGQTVISIIPVSGDWECLSTCREDDGTDSLISEPVIAWGLTAVGNVVPIVPSALDGDMRTHALRKTGDPQVWDSRGGGFETVEAWLKREGESAPADKE
jgi:hypothetical protein